MAGICFGGFLKKLMATKTLQFIATKMKDIDICMMSTTGARGVVSSRPMSNNRDVKYDGTSYFFSDGKTQKVKDLSKSSSVTLSFAGSKGIYIIVTGKGKVIKDKATMQEHWVDDLDAWFEDGIDTKGLVMISVKASNIHYWNKMEEGDIKVK
jgi:general stress protein 26